MKSECEMLGGPWDGGVVMVGDDKDFLNLRIDIVDSVYDVTPGDCNSVSYGLYKRIGNSKKFTYMGVPDATAKRD